MAPDDVQRLSVKIDNLSDQVGRMDERLKGQVLPGFAPMCAVHDRRMDDLEKGVSGVQAAQGKQNLISMTLATVTTGIILAIKAWAGK